jgi:hypothetical protein
MSRQYLSHGLAQLLVERIGATPAVEHVDDLTGGEIERVGEFGTPPLPAPQELRGETHAVAGIIGKSDQTGRRQPRRVKARQSQPAWQITTADPSRR